MKKTLSFVGSLLALFTCTSLIAGTPPWFDPQFVPSPKIYQLVKQGYDNRVTSTMQLFSQDVLQLAKYLTFLEIPEEDNPGPDKVTLFKKTLDRMFWSVPLFLHCEDLDDWECLEQRPWQPYLPPRRQDPEPSEDVLGFGEPLKVNKTFSFKLYFAPADLAPKAQKPMLHYLLKEIEKTEEEILINAFGFDDFVDDPEKDNDGSMKPFLDMIEEKLADEVVVKAILDQEMEGGGRLRLYDVIDDPKKKGFPKIIPMKKKLHYSYAPPKNKNIRKNYWVFGRPKWMDDYHHLKGTDWTELKAIAKKKNLKLPGVPGGYVAALIDLRNVTEDTNMVRMSFQYKGTIQLIKLLNKGIREEDDAMARVEWPAPPIQHNKVLIFDRFRVWTGTTNLTRSGIGTEANSNIALVIKSPEIAQSYYDEFDEMFSFYQQENLEGTDKRFSNPFWVGRAHTKKTVNTHRYFRFRKGTEVRVHFSPTDDGEHRSILPMLYGAQQGDHFRILMFGTSGVEYIRAIQYAVAQGADVTILLDGFSGAQSTGWINWKKVNLCQKNPYVTKEVTPGELLIYFEMWDGQRLQHSKSASLTRKINGRNKIILLTIGSQNWSIGGNDKSDENMVTIRNTKTQLPQFKEYNQFFENLLQDMKGSEDGLLPACG